MVNQNAKTAVFVQNLAPGGGRELVGAAARRLARSARTRRVGGCGGGAHVCAVCVVSSSSVPRGRRPAAGSSQCATSESAPSHLPARRRAGCLSAASRLGCAVACCYGRARGARRAGQGGYRLGCGVRVASRGSTHSSGSPCRARHTPPFQPPTPGTHPRFSVNTRSTPGGASPGRRAAGQARAHGREGV